MQSLQKLLLLSALSVAQVTQPFFFNPSATITNAVLSVLTIKTINTVEQNEFPINENNSQSNENGSQSNENFGRPGTISYLTKKLEALDAPENVKKIIRKQIQLAQQEDHTQKRQSIKRLQMVLDLPWGVKTANDKPLNEISKKLDKNHTGLKHIKEKILEYITIRTLNPNTKTPILCLVGAPGTGKTSIAKSIAKAMDRNFGRVALGGIHGEDEIRGHDSVYIGSSPGRLIKAIQQAESCDPVILLDEIDKMSKVAGHHGDPTAALLEVLDPEQNSEFYDHYLAAPFDLSKVFFIATANYEHEIPEALKDRMEIVRLPGYTVNEKIVIAENQLFKKIKKDLGIAKKNITIDRTTLRYIIENYTPEEGVRNFERALRSVFTKAAVHMTRTKKLPVIDQNYVDMCLQQ